MPVRQLLLHLWQAHKTMLVLLGMLLLANLGLYLALERLLVPELSELESQYIRRQAEVRQLLRHQTGQAESPQQQYLLASQDLDTFYRSIPRYTAFTALVDELVTLSGRAGLEITQINYQPERDRQGELLRYDLAFNVSGRYEQLKKFIHALEQSGRLLVIRSIGLQGSDEGSVNLRLSLETYFRPEAPPHEP
ncbi:MAG: type 4a pilus biogenesis protein PilO [Desulfuromonadales bacterium]|nr:type 4a pilus biogenesis protein PilO [Desulfuromonadales bacterium]